ncbi:MAG: endopeptidase La [Planctomycetes bacterium]|nr:endopeptidase La [Planctomycetota bacterium]
MIIPLAVGRPKSLKLVDDVVVKDRMLALVAQNTKEDEDPSPSQLFDVGTAATILRLMRFPDETTRILVQGLERIIVKRYVKADPYLVAQVEQVESIIDGSPDLTALTQTASNQFQQLIGLMPQLPDELRVAVMNIEDPSKLADMIASHLNISVEERQKLLAELNVKKRLDRVTHLLARDIEVLELGKKIQSDVKTEMDKGQREYYLRQQLKAIQTELGEGDERQKEVEEIRQRLKDAQLPPAAQKEADRELDRLANMSPNASEYTVARTYLDWLADLPWAVATEDKLDVKLSAKILDEDHYDLEKVKERILEHLAVLSLKPDVKAPILCFVGPPGTGKTSVGKSIARALGRNFRRMSLGGVRDEAEIRGHRRTYVGALPGSIIQSIRKAGSNNPVIMLDEVDKLGKDFRGDPASALLEVLDPEQNYAFVDHYLDCPFDLSRVMFIATCNVLDTVPPALMDRMEILELPGYTAEEKLFIAKQYLVPKQIEAHGLEDKSIRFDDKSIRLIVSNYTREAGVRNLERSIASICRKLAKKIAEGTARKKGVTPAVVRNLLGHSKFFPEVAERTSDPGVATGLAVTQTGGDILFIESIKIPGQEKLTLTGSLGDVMKESAQAALSYVRANAKKLGVDPEAVQKHEIHIHVPAGAIPKDGPSAGITISASLISLFSAEPVRSDVAMTGEITLRGRVLRVGGIKEKVLAAKRAGIKTVVLPKDNKMDLEDVPEQAKKELDFRFVERIDDILPIAFDGAEAASRKKAKKNKKGRKNKPE